MMLTETIIAATAKLVGIPTALLLSVCYQESRFVNTVNPLDGNNSASWGVCQVKVATAQRYIKGVRPPSLMKREVNVLAAAKYLKAQLDRYDGRVNCAIEAYNKGTAKSCSGRYVASVNRHMKTRFMENHLDDLGVE